MPVEPHITVANALVDFINGRTWSLAPIAVRRYVEFVDSIEADQLRVCVFPGELLTDDSSRGFSREDHTTWFIVAQRVSDAQPVTVDPLVHFARELRDALLDASLPEDADVIDLDTSDLYDLVRLTEQNLFVQTFGLVWRREP